LPPFLNGKGFFMANSPMAVGEGGGDRLVGWVLGDLRQLVVGVLLQGSISQ
jgi:hypothetical protein